MFKRNIDINGKEFIEYKGFKIYSDGLMINQDNEEVLPRASTNHGYYYPPIIIDGNIHKLKASRVLYFLFKKDIDPLSDEALSTRLHYEDGNPYNLNLNNLSEKVGRTSMRMFSSDEIEEIISYARENLKKTNYKAHNDKNMTSVFLTISNKYKTYPTRIKKVILENAGDINESNFSTALFKKNIKLNEKINSTDTAELIDYCIELSKAIDLLPPSMSYASDVLEKRLLLIKQKIEEVQQQDEK